MKILVTGAAGFIGAALVARLLARGDEVIGVDNLSDYYDVALKQARLDRLAKLGGGFRFEKLDIADSGRVRTLFSSEEPEVAVNLAAQAGVRYSLTHPHAYVSANIQGFLNILEACRNYPVRHLVYASSSSVYGANRKVPFSVSDPVNHPISLYAASKRANELMAHSYSHLFGVPSTGLRFFTVYGPWGRPDMAMFHFTRSILQGQTIELFNQGRHRRDFTYIDDIVEGVVRVVDRPATPDTAWKAENPYPESSSAPFRLYNIGNSSPVWLNEVIECLERELGRKALTRPVPMQPGDVLETHADVASLEREMGYRPRTSVAEGVARFVSWYLGYYGAG